MNDNSLFNIFTPFKIYLGAYCLGAYCLGADPSLLGVYSLIASKSDI